MHNERAEAQLDRELERVESEIESLKATLSQKKKRRLALSKARRALGGKPTPNEGKKVNPTLMHVEAAIRAAFKEQERFTVVGLQSRVEELLKSREISRQGLSLRIHQGISRLGEPDAQGHLTAEALSRLSK